MNRDFGTLHINRLIVHDVPKRSWSVASEPVLSETDSILTAALRNFFREKITDSMKSAASEVVFDADVASPVAGIVHACLVTQESDFVASSCEIARHLHQTQTGVNPAGLLVVMEANIDNKTALVVLKLEREEGIRVEELFVEGKRTFSVEHIQDLMFTGKTKVYKAALFVRDDNAGDSTSILISDKQNGAKRGTDIADFFLKRFLGCKLRELPEIVTQRYFQTVQDFIKKDVRDAENKAKYQIALIATLHNQQQDIDPRRFAEENLVAQDRDIFLRKLSSRQVPIQSFAKDIAVIEPELRKMHFTFQSGLILVASPQAYEERVRMSDTEDGSSHVEFTDKLENVTSKR